MNDRKPEMELDAPVFLNRGGKEYPAVASDDEWFTDAAVVLDGDPLDLEDSEVPF